jgi:hypothetical protein
MVKLVLICIGISSTCLLSSSSFFLSDYLDHQFISNNYSESVLRYAQKINHAEALSIVQAQKKNW